jgi:hypothetical protein
MLHVWPRLRLVQEQRQVLGIADQLPDLNRLTAFATIMPETAVAPGRLSAPPFCILKPHPDRYPLPFYLERLLEHTEAPFVEGPFQRLTQAELAAAQLLARAQEDGYVEPLPIAHLPMADDVMEAPPASRAAMFRAGINAANTVARVLLSQVIDPTRIDSVQARDPFVQTTIYVVASLAEPLASALVWPVVSELVATLRSRHVAKVIALLSTGSFAEDDTRVVEEAAVYVALAELEALTGVRGRSDSTDALRQFVKAYGRPGWAQRVGRKLFDTVYLLDREKSNQALAQSPYELAVLVGNALEAFLVADGSTYLDKNLGPDVSAGPSSPYSILGAASDYVPLAEYIAAAIEEEQLHLIRSEVLTAGDQPGTGTGSLEDLGITPEKVTERFLNAGPNTTFEREAGQRERSSLAGPRVARDYVLPEALARELRSAKELSHWQALLEAHLQKVAVELEQASVIAQEAWGFAASDPDAGETMSPGASGSNLAGAPATGLRSDSGLIPDAMLIASERILSDICSAPNGILGARARVAGWIREVEAVLLDLDREPLAREPSDHRQRELEGWRREFAAAVANQPLASAMWLRVALFGGFAWVLLSLALLFQTAFPLSQRQQILVAVSSVALLVVLVLIGWLAVTQHIRRLKRQRIAMAQEHLSEAAQQMLQQGLFRVYRRLHRELRHLQTIIQGTIDDLEGWARSEGPSEALLAGVNAIYLRRAHPDDQLWQRIRDRIKEETAEGKNSRNRFRELWRAEGSALRDWQEQGDGLVRHVRRTLEPGPNPVEDEVSLARIFRAFAARATGYLCPRHRLLADHRDFVLEVAARYGIEGLLFDGGSSPSAGTADHSQIAFVEDIYTRAKPSANYEVMYTLPTSVVEVEFGVTPAGTDSALQRAFEQRNISLLSSQDPLSLSLVRTVNRLALQDVTLAERCRREYVRLHQRDRSALTLLAPEQVEEAHSLYGDEDEEIVAYEQPIMSSAP